MATRNVVFKFSADTSQIQTAISVLRSTIADAQKILGNLRAKVDTNQAKKDLAQLKSDLKVAEKERIIKVKADTKRAEIALNETNKQARQLEKERIIKLKTDDAKARAAISENLLRLKALEQERIIRLKFQLQGDRDAARKAIRDAEKAAKDSQKSFSAFGQSVKGALLAFAGVEVAQGLLDLTKNALSASIAIEKIQISYRTLIGDAEQADRVFNQIKEFAIETPFEVKELTDAGRILLQYGITAEDLTKTLKQLGDITASGTASLGNVALAYGQIAAKGKLQGEEIRQLVNSGFNPLQEIARTTGETIESLSYRLEQGQISFEEVAEALKTATSEGGRFFEATKALSETLGGRISKLKDNFFFLSVTLGDSLKPAATVVVESLIELTTRLQQLPEKIERNKALITAITGAIIAYTVSVKINSQELFKNIGISIRKNVIDRAATIQTNALSTAEKIKTAAMAKGNIVARIAVGTTTALNIATKALWATIRANPLGALITVITAGISAWQLYKDAKDKALDVDPNDIAINTARVARDLDATIQARFQKEEILIKNRTSLLRNNLGDLKKFNEELKKIGEEYGIQVANITSQADARKELLRVENELLKIKNAQIRADAISSQLDPLLERKAFLERQIPSETRDVLKQEIALRQQLQRIIQQQRNISINPFKPFEGVDVTKSAKEFEDFLDEVILFDAGAVGAQQSFPFQFDSLLFDQVVEIKRKYDALFENTALDDRAEELKKINALIESLNVSLTQIPPPIKEPKGGGSARNYYKELKEEAAKLAAELENLIKPIEDFDVSILPDVTEEQQNFKTDEIYKNDVYWAKQAVLEEKAAWDERVAQAKAAGKNLKEIAALDAIVQDFFEAKITRDEVLERKKRRNALNNIEKEWNEKDLQVRRDYWDLINETDIYGQERRAEALDERLSDSFKGIEMSGIGRRTVDKFRLEAKILFSARKDAIKQIEKLEIDAAEEKLARDKQYALDNISDPIDRLNFINKAEAEYRLSKKRAEDKSIKDTKDAQLNYDEYLKEAEKQRKLRIIGDIETITNATIEGINRVNEARIREADIAIEAQEKRVERAKEIAEKGNAELYELEKERLEKLQQERAKFVRQQQAIIVLQIAAESALAVARAAAEGGGFLSPVLVASVIATLLAGFAAARSASAQSVGGFETGGYTGDGNKKEVAGVVHKGEFVFTKEQTTKNRKFFEEIYKGRDPFLAAGVGQQILVMNNSGMEERLSRIEKAIMEQSRLNLSIDESGIHGIVSHYQWKNQRIQNRTR